MHNIRSKITFIIFSVVIFFLFTGILEIVLRTTHLFGATISCSEPDNLLGWRYTPGCNFWFCEENNHPVTVKFNNYSFRDKDWILEKPKNIYRIAILGDSFTEAFSSS